MHAYGSHVSDPDFFLAHMQRNMVLTSLPLPLHLNSQVDEPCDCVTHLYDHFNRCVGRF